MLSNKQKHQFDTEGYLVVSDLFESEEINFYRTHFEKLRQEQNAQRDDIDPTSNDPLVQYPRIMQPHRRDEASLKWVIDKRINAVLVDLLGCEPYVAQTMFYFKPAGARGQAMHQDQYFLRVQPGTCIAAWMAVDDCDEANGCLRVLPGSHTWPLLCTTDADNAISFTDVTVELPDDANLVPVEMLAGDVLFFNGQLVHGSLPNTTTDRFRRALIGHYLVGEAEKVHQWYHPVLKMDGTPMEIGLSEKGGECGVWVSLDDERHLEMKPEIVD